MDGVVVLVVLLQWGRLQLERGGRLLAHLTGQRGTDPRPLDVRGRGGERGVEPTDGGDARVALLVAARGPQLAQQAARRVQRVEVGRVGRAVVLRRAEDEPRRALGDGRARQLARRLARARLDEEGAPQASGVVRLQLLEGAARDVDRGVVSLDEGARANALEARLGALDAATGCDEGGVDVVLLVTQLEDSLVGDADAAQGLLLLVGAERYQR